MDFRPSNEPVVRLLPGNILGFLAGPGRDFDCGLLRNRALE
jgi:hypothetical protein